MFFEYDENGNMLFDGAFYYGYDGFNKLRSVRLLKSTGPLVSKYWYDSGGIRFKKEVYSEEAGNETTFYLGDMVRVVNSSGSYDTVYVEESAGTLLARVDDGDYFYYHLDYFG